MATKRHKPEEIVTKLRQVEVLVGNPRIGCHPAGQLSRATGRYHGVGGVLAYGGGYSARSRGCHLDCLSFHGAPHAASMAGMNALLRLTRAVSRPVTGS